MLSIISSGNRGCCSSTAAHDLFSSLHYVTQTDKHKRCSIWIAHRELFQSLWIIQLWGTLFLVDQWNSRPENWLEAQSLLDMTHPIIPISIITPLHEHNLCGCFPICAVYVWLTGRFPEPCLCVNDCYVVNAYPIHFINCKTNHKESSEFRRSKNRTFLYCLKQAQGCS
jgi:hypothetical protein